MLLEHGINLGGYLSQCRHTPEHYENFITKEDIRIIKEAGFDHVRVPVDYNVWETEDGQPKASGYALTDRVVEWCESYGINIILDLHKACGYDFNNANNAEKNNLFSNKELQDRFVELWRRNSARYCGKKNVAFELLNEVVEADNVDAWNSLIERTVETIRENAKTTPIIYGGIQYNNVEKVKFLSKPHDENIIFTFHFYSPMPFTHQKASWVDYVDKDLTTYYPAPEKDWTIDYPRQVVLDGVEAAKKNNVRLYCGEFGVIEAAPVDSTLNWYKDVVQVFREYGIGYAPWTYKSMAFGIYGEHYAPIKDELVKVLTNK